MNEDRFIDKNKENWATLETYNNRLYKKNINCLNKGELKTYAMLFRAAGTHLAYARTHFQDSQTVVYLNQLVGTSHNFFYTKEKKGLSDVLGYVKWGFPERIRIFHKYIIAACLCFLLGFLFSFILVMRDEQNIAYFFSGIGDINMQTDSTAVAWNYPLMSSVIMVNNIQVAFLAIALGLTAGLGTMYILALNGMMLGGLTSYIILKGGSMLSFWALILPHGFLELGAVFISGAAGIMIGRGILIPGDLKRKDSLITWAKEAVKLIPGITMMLIAAGFIEGFITPAPIAAIWKIFFSAIIFLLMALYAKFA